MNVQDGEILGLGSSPTFDPSVFTKPVIPESTYKQLTSDTTGSPLTDRAIQGLYPTGSTFKPITAIAALESGVHDAEHDDRRQGLVHGGRDHRCTTRAAARTARSSCPQALQVSSDVFFYNVGAMLYQHGGDAQQKWASELGIGHPTGIDLPGEVAGLLPTPAWRNKLYKEHQTDRPWTEGDNVNLAVGQGDLQADPLQMAVAYAAIANGGDVVRPHVGTRGRGPEGRRGPGDRPGASAPSGHQPGVQPARSSRASTWRPSRPAGPRIRCSGTSRSRWPARPGRRSARARQDQSWYVALAPYPNPQIVVAATIEQGGFGVESAAPVARQILDAYYNTHKQAAKAAGGKVPVAGPDPGRPRPEHGGRRGEPLLMVSDAYPRPFDERRSAGAAERAGVLGLDPLLSARGARADRLQPLHARRR